MTTALLGGSVELQQFYKTLLIGCSLRAAVDNLVHRGVAVHTLNQIACPFEKSRKCWWDRSGYRYVLNKLVYVLDRTMLV